MAALRTTGIIAILDPFPALVRRPATYFSSSLVHFPVLSSLLGFHCVLIPYLGLIALLAMAFP